MALPWRCPGTVLPNKGVMAEKRLSLLTRRLARKPELRKGYITQPDEHNTTTEKNKSAPEEKKTTPHQKRTKPQQNRVTQLHVKIPRVTWSDTRRNSSTCGKQLYLDRHSLQEAKKRGISKYKWFSSLQTEETWA